MPTFNGFLTLYVLDERIVAKTNAYTLVFFWSENVSPLNFGHPERLYEYQYKTDFSYCGKMYIS